MVTDPTQSLEADLDSKGQAKLLGECSFELDSILASLIESEGVGVKKPLKLTRSQGGNIVTVGRFLATFKVVGDYNPEELPQSSDIKKSQLKSMMDLTHELPPIDFGFSKWRVRVGAYCAIGAPSAAAKFPSLALETGWSQYKHEEPSAFTMISTGVIEENRHPVWNEELVMNNPTESDKPSKALERV